MLVELGPAKSAGKKTRFTVLFRGWPAFVVGLPLDGQEPTRGKLPRTAVTE